MLRFLTLLFSTLFLFAMLGAAAVLGVFWHYGRGLPDYHQLAHYEPPVTTRVYAGDGRLVAEYAVEKRSFVPINAMPQRVINAFLAAEDKNFFQHSGVDPLAIIRAVVTNLRNRGMGGDHRPVGASTITQQVVKNFLLSNEVSIERKIKEAILAFRIEQTFSKQHILELYLNEIYLGQGSYGVAAAALNYFDKGVDELTVGEVAFLAALPKAPNNYNPIRYPQAAREHRNMVIGRMADDGFITRAEAQAALNEPLVTRPRAEAILVKGGEYFAEDIRREIADEYGEDALYKGGLSVRSTLDPALQEIAARVLRKGLVEYDRRHGWRGPVNHIELGAGWQQRLAALPNKPELAPWTQAVVLTLADAYAEIGFADGRRGRIPMNELKWARPTLAPLRLGPVPRKPAEVLKQGDVVAVEPAKQSEDGKERYAADAYALRQVPKVEGALVAIDPHTGRVLAMQGGFSYARSQFNRATQAVRQPGSSFKPFVYMAALDNGYTPSSLVLNTPVEYSQGPGLPMWRPKNYHAGEGGTAATLRVAMEKSLNLVTIRLGATIGMSKVASVAERFGVVDKLPHELAMLIGACDTTPIRMATAYAQIVNGGRKITPTLIDRIQDRNGMTIYRHDDRHCDNCQSTFYTNQEMPQIPDNREQIIDPMTAYQMVHILEGVVERGTGRVVASVGKPLGGKTGTSNDSKDTWFDGFSPDLAVSVFVGFDEPASLGDHETGSTAAAPIFRDFMAEALKDKPPTPFRAPPGIRLVRVNPSTGRLAEPGDKAIYEAFKPNSVPTAAPEGQEEVLENDAGVMGLGYSPMSDINRQEGEGEAGAQASVRQPLPQADVGIAPTQTLATPPAAVAPLVPAAPPPAPPAAQPQAGGLY